ncbi:MAG: hypothetical protein Q9211_006554 [Gyalolechia sp. 1 TL-2023]
MTSYPDSEALKRNGFYHDQPTSKLFNPILQELFEQYSHLKPEEILPHLLHIREKAWAIYPWPCIGLFRFCELYLSKHPAYPRILAALQHPTHPSTLLDLGCCFGQDIRKLVFDGAPAESLVGCDLDAAFLDLGYELFGDRERLQTPMFAADIFQDDGPLAEKRGTFDFVHANLILHLFSWDRQVEACKQVVKLLKPEPGSTVLGRQTGNLVAQQSELHSVGMVWRHDDRSFREMWRQVGEETGTRWDVWVEVEEVEEKQQEPGICFLTFEVRRE